MTKIVSPTREAFVRLDVLGGGGQRSPMFFSDLHVQLLSRGILNPGEQLVSQTVTSYTPWWAMGLIQRQYLVLATDQRLILIDHRLQFFPLQQRLHAVDSMAWSNVQELKVTGIFKKKLRVRGMGERGPVAHKCVIPNALFGLLAPMNNNMQGARAIAAAHVARTQGARALSPAPQAYGAPPNGYAPPAQLQAPQGGYPQQGQYGQQPAMPPVNAPGYQSVPPGAPYGSAPFGSAPVASPFDPPPRSY